MIPSVKKYSKENGFLDLSAIDWRSEMPENIKNEAYSISVQTDGGVPCEIEAGKSENEAYTLEIGENGVKIFSGSEAGAFYALQTLKQMIAENGVKVPFCKIEDAPDLKVRGFYYDITRGRVPTMDMLKKIVDTIAGLKFNMFQLYVENTFDFAQYEGITDKENMLTAEEIKELDRYCKGKYIELVPSLSTFGHLYDLLSSEKYKHLCELENYEPTEHYWIEKMRHHTIDAYNEESLELIFNLIDTYAELFTSDKFNICCDETFDLCKGRNEGKDAGETYFEFVNKIIAHLNEKGKKVQMWGDIALVHAEKISLLKGDVTFLNWDYAEKPDEERVKKLHEEGLVQILCPGVSSWNRIVADKKTADGNISLMAVYAKKYSADGMLTTAWGDFGHVISHNGWLFELMTAGERSWNATDKELGAEFDKEVSLLAYNSDVDLMPYITRLSEADKYVWCTLVGLYSDLVMNKRERDVPKAGEFENSMRICDEVIAELERLGQNEAVSDLIVAAEGIKVCGEACLKICGKRVEKGFCNAWLEKYSKLWMRESKRSELGRIKEFLNAVDEL